MDDLGTPVALGLGLTGHRAPHDLGQFDVFDLDEGHLDAPRVGDVVDDALQPLVDLVPVDQQLVEIDLTEDAAQRRLAICEVPLMWSSIATTERFGSTMTWTNLRTGVRSRLRGTARYPLVPHAVLS